MKKILVRFALALLAGLLLSLCSLAIVSRHEMYGAHGFPLGYFQTGVGTACNGGFEYSFAGIFADGQCKRSFTDGGQLFFYNWLVWSAIVFSIHSLVVWRKQKGLSVS